MFEWAELEFEEHLDFNTCSADAERWARLSEN